MEKRQQMCEPAERHQGSSSPLMLPNPYVTGQSSRGSRSGLSLNRSHSNINGAAAGKGGDMPRSQSYRNSQHARQISDHLLESNRMVRDPHAKVSKNNDSQVQGRITGKNSVEAQKRGLRSTRSAPNSAGRSKPAQADLMPFEVTMADFPELAGISLSKTTTLAVQKEGRGLKQISVAPKTQTVASPWKTGDKRLSYTQQNTLNEKPDSPAISQGQLAVTSWANVASQPPKKPAAKEQVVSDNIQMGEVTPQQEEGAQAKKKRKKKKKKTKGVTDDADADSEEMPLVYQEPPRFEDEEEFPGLTPALTGTSRLITSSNTAKLCNEENQRDGIHQVGEQNKEKPAAKAQVAEKAKKGQKTEKESGKKSKVPVQLDIGNMLAALEKKQQSQKSKQDTNLVISVGGGLPVVHKQAPGQKKKLWQQDKIAHNPLDSTSPLVKKGKQREVPKAKKPTPLKKVILKEREERKQRRLLEERGLLPDSEATPAEEATEAPDEEISQDTAGEENDDDDNQQVLDGTEEMVKEANGESDKEEAAEQHATSTVADPASRPKIHSRKFRDYCSQMLSRDVDECVTALLKELVRFQDRLYQKDPMKARMKRRIVMGLREVLKHLKLRKVKCVIISPNCERIQSKGGLDEALHTIIDTCREQGVPFVFALSRKALGRCVNKVVPVSLVGIFNYDGAQDFYHKMIELSSEARRAYEVMVSSLEQTGQAEPKENPEDPQINMESEPAHDSIEPEEEPQYMKIWKKMLEKECNHKFLNIEEQLSSVHLDSECYENTEEEKS